MATAQFSKKGFIVWAVCALFFLYEFALRTILGSYQEALIQDLNITAIQFSILSTTLFLVVYGCMQIPVGLIINNFGLKNSLLFGTLACFVATLGFAYADSFYIAILFRCLMGLGAAFGFICLLVAVRDWMPEKYIGVFIGLSQFIGTLGPILMAGPLDSLADSMGISWRTIFIYASAVSLVLLLLIYFFVDNNNDKAGKYTILKRPEKISTSISKLFTHSQVWYLALLSACLYFTIEYFSENEGRAFLALKGFSMNTASYMLSISWLGYALGSPIMGLLSDLLQRRKIIISISAVIGLFAMLTILYASNKLTLQIAFLGLGVSASGQGICFATVSEYFKKSFVSIGFGLNNAVIMTLSGINAPLIGLALDYIKQDQCITVYEYVSIFLIFVVMYAVAILLAVFFIKETFCSSVVEFKTINIAKNKAD